MTAVYTYEYSIDPSYDLTDATAETMFHLLQQTWGPTIEAQRAAWISQLMADGITPTPNHSYTLLDREARLLTSSRDSINPTAIEPYKDWHDTQVPTVLGIFTQTVSVIVDGESVADKPLFETI